MIRKCSSRAAIRKKMVKIEQNTSNERLGLKGDVAHCGARKFNLMTQ
jgi:hypothetical protein